MLYLYLEVGTYQISPGSKFALSDWVVYPTEGQGLTLEVVIGGFRSHCIPQEVNVLTFGKLKISFDELYI